MALYRSISVIGATLVRFYSPVLFISGKQHSFVASARMAPQTPIHTRSSSVEDITLPKREHGYATKPYEWNDLVNIIQHEQDLAKLSRSVQQETEYQFYKRDLAKKWKSVYDHILHSKFGFDKRPVAQCDGEEEDSIMWESDPQLSNVETVQKVLVPNDFPYYNADNIEHWVLWKLCEDVTEDDIQQAKQDLRDQLGDVVDVLHWTNPPHLKSLPGIDHAHIICLREGPGRQSIPN